MASPSPLNLVVYHSQQGTCLQERQGLWKAEYLNNVTAEKVLWFQLAIDYTSLLRVYLPYGLTLAISRQEIVY